MKKFRERKRMKIIDCAKDVGVSPSTYRDWEQGRSIKGEPYKDIARVLGVSLSDLLGEEKSALVKELQWTLEALQTLEGRVKSLLSSL